MTDRRTDDVPDFALAYDASHGGAFSLLKFYLNEIDIIEI
jgi:hypothetical protein